MKNITKYLSLIIKILIVISVIVGIVATSGATRVTSDAETAESTGFMAGTTFLYFTIQSNLTIGAICLVFAVIEIVNLIKEKQGKPLLVIPNWLRTVKFVFTVAITLTFLVFSLILSPTFFISGTASYLWSASNIFCHNLTPILAILDWLLYDYVYKSNKYSFIYGIIMPLYYVAFAYICDAFKVQFQPGMTVPYFFFDYHTLGWFRIDASGIGAAYWIALLVLMVFGIGWVLMWGKNKVAAKTAQKTEVQTEETQKQE